MVPPPAQQTTGYVMQFLSGILSQRGPDALPYAEDTKWLIRQQLLSLIEVFPSLTPKSSHFTHNDGRAANLLQAEGTIPIVYAGVVYNIPATIWLLENYPRAPPAVFLTPTRDMVVKPNHPHVDRSGHVSVPYLRAWVFPSSNLVELVRSLSHLFGQDPPLYTRQPTGGTNPNPNPNPISNPPVVSQQTVSRPPVNNYPVPVSPSPYAGRFPPSPQHHRPTEDPAEVFRRNSINKLVEMVHNDASEIRKKTEAEMEGMLAAQAELKRREEVLARGVREMQSEMEGLEQELQVVLMNADVLEGWVRDNEGKTMGADCANVPVDDFFVVNDSLSRQLLECSSSDMGLEDTVYALDRAVQDGDVPFDKYLKSVRALSREQFFHRAMSAKVRAAQQMQASNIVRARMAQYINS